MNSHMKSYIGQGPEGSQAQKLLPLWSLGRITLPARGRIHQPGSSLKLII